MVSSGEIVREHSGHVAVCCSAIGASPVQRGTDGPAARGAQRQLSSPRVLQWSARGKVALGVLFGRSGNHLMQIAGEYSILSSAVSSCVNVTLCRGDPGDALQMDVSTLREKAREAIQNGKLPTRSPDSTMGGPGCGEACALCGETLPRNQMELEAVFGEIPEMHKYHLHPRCFAAWECEREGRTSPE